MPDSSTAKAAALARFWLEPGFAPEIPVPTRDRAREVPTEDGFFGGIGDRGEKEGRTRDAPMG